MGEGDTQIQVNSNFILPTAHTLKEPTCRASAPGTVSWEPTAVGGRDTPVHVSHMYSKMQEAYTHGLSEIHTDGLPY